MRLGFGMAAAGVAVAGIAAVALAQQPASPPVRADRVKAMFAAADTNKDGYIDKAEAEAARATMRQRADAARRAARDRAFARLDADHNGSVSRAEFDAAPRMAMMGAARPDRMERRGDRGRGRGAMMAGGFERMDADHDGRVSLAEAEAAQSRRFAMRGGGGRGMRWQGHPPMAGAPAPAMSDADRPLGGGRD